MNSSINRTITVLILTAISSCLLSSCKTIKGLGRDMQHLGAKIETKAEQKSGY